MPAGLVAGRMAVAAMGREWQVRACLRREARYDPGVPALRSDQFTRSLRSPICWRHIA